MLPLPGGYWWSDSADRSVLYLRYGLAASVTSTGVEIGGRGGHKLSGRCGSITQGKRFVERWVLGQVHGTYRRWKARWTPPKAHVSTQVDLGYAALMKNCRKSTPALILARPPVAFDAELATSVWCIDVPLEQLKELTAVADHVRFAPT